MVDSLTLVPIKWVIHGGFDPDYWCGAVISDGDAARLRSSWSVASCLYNTPAPLPSSTISTVHSQAMSHKVQHVGLSNTKHKRKRWGAGTMLNETRVTAGSWQRTYRKYILLQSHRIYCLAEGKNSGKTWGRRLASRTGWLSPTSAALPKKVCLSCKCVSVCACARHF